MSIESIVIKFILSIITACGYALYVNGPKRSILPSGINAAIGFVLYETMVYYKLGMITAGFTASFVIGVISEFLSRRYRMPATVFLVPSFVMLVPGRLLFSAMQQLITEHKEMFLLDFMNALLVAISLSLGIAVSSIFSRSLRSFNYKESLYVQRKKNKN